jgi:hypothetical protein
MGRGGPRANSGRKPGTATKAETGLEIARRKLKEAGRTGKVTDETIDAFDELCKVAKLFMNQAAEQQKRKAETGKFDRELFNDMLIEARDTLKIIVQYQRPTYRAIALVDQQKDAVTEYAKDIAPLVKTKTIDQEGNVVQFPTDQVAAARSYQRMMALDDEADRAAGD